MRHVSVIGIGAGDPEQLTLQAVGALRALDVAFVVEKEGEAAELSRFREAMLARHGCTCRVVRIGDPRRDRDDPAYDAAVDAWRAARAEAWGRALRSELPEHARGGFLVWGDPSLYDSTIAVLDQVLAAGTAEFDYDVIPGVSSLHALAARHRVPLNRVGGAVQVTTGRRLREGLPHDVDDVVVMLDGGCSFRTLDNEDLEIFWGAYLGTPDELLVAGPVEQVGAEIERVRAEARARKGWVMDTYLLRRRHA